jgi:fibronectin-binding autotransporter adhesin
MGSASNPINVAGPLTLAGRLNVDAMPGFGPGSYAPFHFGSLVDDVLQMGRAPEGFLYSIVTDAAHNEVDLIVSAPVPVPEPSGLVVMGLGAVALLYARRRSRSGGAPCAP